jgi:DNA invertase Pin-like site-specific DNA recombinase
MVPSRRMGPVVRRRSPTITRRGKDTYETTPTVVPTSHTSVRAVLYARVYTTDQTCEMQIRELREYVLRRGWTIAVEYVDTGWSRAKASRPELDRLMSDASQRRFDCVVVYKIDRFGRSVLHLNQQLATLSTYGVLPLVICAVGAHC